MPPVVVIVIVLGATIVGLVDRPEYPCTVNKETNRVEHCQPKPSPTPTRR